MAKNKFYVVFEGKTPGIYETWAECQEQTKGIKGAKYKSFSTVSEAEEALKKHISHDSLTEEEIAKSISVDVSCLGNPGIMEYKIVKTIDEELLFLSPKYTLGTNNIGEFLALVNGMQMVQKEGDMDRIIFADSQTALSWVRKKKVNTNLIHNSETEDLHKAIREAIQWLQNINVDEFKIVKWETHLHGEIKADFGRKTSKKN